MWYCAFINYYKAFDTVYRTDVLLGKSKVEYNVILLCINAGK